MNHDFYSLPPRLWLMTCFATCCGFLINYFFSLPHPASHTPALSSDIQIQSQKGQQSNDDQLELTESNQVSSRWIRMPHPKWWMFLSTCWCRTGKIKEEQKKEKKEFDCTFEHSLMWFSSNWHSNKESTHTHTHTQTHTRRKNRATSTKPASALRFYLLSSEMYRVSAPVIDDHLSLFTGVTGFSKRPIRHPHLLKVTDFFQRKKKDDGPERNPYIGSHSTPSLVDPVRVLIF